MASSPTVHSPAVTAESQMIERQLNVTRQQVRLVELGAALVAWLIGVLVYLLAVVVVDHWILTLGPVGRSVALLGLLVGCVVYGMLVVWPLLRREINPVYAARAIEESTPSLKNSLINFLLLRRDSSGTKEAILSAVEKRAALDISTVPVDLAVDRSHLIRLGYVLLAVASFFAVYKFQSPKDPFQTVARVFAPWANIARPSRVFIRDVTPGSVDVYHGAVLPVECAVFGLREGEPVELIYSSLDGQIVNQKVSLDASSATRFTGQLPPADADPIGSSSGIQLDLVYRIQAGDCLTDEFRVQVSPAPTIVVDKLTYDFPAYTRRAQKVVLGQGDIQALEGTTVTIFAQANQTIQAATLELDPGENGKSATESVKMTVDGKRAWVSLPLQLASDGHSPWRSSYQIRYNNEQGNTNPQPIVHRIDVLADLPPEIEWLAPEEMKVDLPADGKLLLELRAVDPDFGLAFVRLHGLRNGESLLDRSLLPSQPAFPPQAIVRYEFLPRQLGLEAGEEIVCWGAAADGKATTTAANGSSANSVRTSNLTIRIVEPVGNKNGNTPGSPQPDMPPNSDKQQPNPPENKQPPSAQDQNKPDQEKDPAKNEKQETEKGANSENEKSQGDSQSGSDDSQKDQNEPKEGEKQAPNSEDSQQSGSNDDQNKQGSGKSEDEPMSGNSGGSDENSGGGSEGGSSEDSQSQSGGSGGQEGGDSQSKPQTGGEQGGNANSKQNGTEGGTSADQGEGGGKSSQSGGGKNSSNQNSNENSGGNNSQQPNSKQPSGNEGKEPGSSDSNSEGSQGKGNSPDNSGKGNSDGQKPEHDGQAFERMLDRIKNDPNHKLHDALKKQIGKERPAGDQRPAEGEAKQGEARPPQAGDKPATDSAADQSSGEGGDSNSSQNPSGTAGQPNQEPTGKQPPVEGVKPDSKPEQGTPDKPALPDKKNGEGGQQQAAPGEGGETQKNERLPQEGPRTGESGADQGEKKDPGTANNGDSGAGANSEDKSGNAAQEGPDRNRPKSLKPDSSNPEKGETSPPGNSKQQSDSQGDESGDQKGGGKKGDGQSAGQEGNGGAGSKSAADQGSGQADESGMGETGTQAGNQELSGDKTGQSSGSESGQGSASGKPPMGQDNPEGSSNDAGEGKPTDRDPNSASGGEGGEGGKRGHVVGGGKAPDSQGNDVGNYGGTQEVQDGDQANLEYARRATDLIVDHLADQQHDPDPELLKQMGWTKDEMRQFVQRWKALKDAAGETPEARQELDESLRSLGLRNPSNKQRAHSGTNDDFRDLNDSGSRSTPPNRYRDQFDAFRKGVGR